MSSTAVNSNFPLGKFHYFFTVPYPHWSLEDFSSWISTHLVLEDEKNKNHIFYNMLYLLYDDISTSPDIRARAEELIKQKKKVSFFNP